MEVVVVEEAGWEAREAVGSGVKAAVGWVAQEEAGSEVKEVEDSGVEEEVMVVKESLPLL